MIKKLEFLTFETIDKKSDFCKPSRASLASMFYKINELVDEVNAFKQGQATAEEQRFGEWISVKDSMPEITDMVLISIYNKRLKIRGVDMDSFSGGGWEEFAEVYDPKVWSVTHWMPLPEPPKERSEV